MKDKEFDVHCAKAHRQLFPSAEQEDGPTGEVLIDATFVRELMGRLGSCRLWNRSLRKALLPFATAYRELQHEAAEANRAGHEYPSEDSDLFSVHVEHLRRAAALVDVR